MRPSVAVVLGGVSSEHEISLSSGTGMLRNIDRKRFSPFPILILPTGEWVWPAAKEAFSEIPDRATVGSWASSPPSDWKRVRVPDFEAFPRADLYLLALHGKGGEDGRLQGLLDWAGQPYTGSGVLGSAAAMDKIVSKRLYASAGLPTADFRVLPPEASRPEAAADLIEALGLPLVVKQPDGGSSLGVAIVSTAEDLRACLDQWRGQTLLCEKFLTGREATCGVLEYGPTLPPTEIRPLQDAYFNHAAKYESGRTREITPGEFPDAVLASMQRLARQAHEALGLSIYSRTDFIVTDEGPVILETNNLPGFTPTSIIPQQAAHVGLEYAALLSHLIEKSLEHWRPLFPSTSS